MLVTFTCDAHENIIMFGSVALRLLKMMGQSGVVPCAILAENVPEALERLTTAIEQEKVRSQTAGFTEDDEEQEISLAHRAIPLIKLLKNAAAQQCSVLWK